MNKVWIDKKLIDADKAGVSVFDRGFMYGDGIFETMRGYGGALFKIDEHLTRLDLSLKAACIRPPYPRAYLKKEVYRLLDINKLKDSYVRITVTRGSGRFGIGQAASFKPLTVIVAKEFFPYPERMYEKGISASVVSIRQNELSPLSSIKSVNFMNYIMARLEANGAGSDEAIILNTKGCVAEAATSNVFAAFGDMLATPSTESGALAGITRGAVIAIARRSGIRVTEAVMTYKDLSHADEIFLTSSLAEILPVTKLNRKRVGSGRPGRMTKLLGGIYKKEARGIVGGMA